MIGPELDPFDDPNNASFWNRPHVGRIEECWCYRAGDRLVPMARPKKPEPVADTPREANLRYCLNLAVSARERYRAEAKAASAALSNTYKIAEDRFRRIIRLVNDNTSLKQREADTRLEMGNIVARAKRHAKEAYDHVEDLLSDLAKADNRISDLLVERDETDVKLQTTAGNLIEADRQIDELQKQRAECDRQHIKILYSQEEKKNAEIAKLTKDNTTLSKALAKSIDLNLDLVTKQIIQDQAAYIAREMFFGPSS